MLTIPVSAAAVHRHHVSHVETMLLGNPTQQVTFMSQALQLTSKWLGRFKWPVHLDIVGHSLPVQHQITSSGQGNKQEADNRLGHQEQSGHLELRTHSGSI